jgi:hypothetical protein
MSSDQWPVEMTGCWPLSLFLTPEFFLRGNLKREAAMMLAWLILPQQSIPLDKL